MPIGDERKLGDKNATTLVYKWDLEDDTLLGTMEISLVSRKRGESQNRNWKRLMRILQ